VSTKQLLIQYSRKQVYTVLASAPNTTLLIQCIGGQKISLAPEEKVREWLRVQVDWETMQQELDVL